MASRHRALRIDCWLSSRAINAAVGQVHPNFSAMPAINKFSPSLCGVNLSSCATLIVSRWKTRAWPVSNGEKEERRKGAARASARHQFAPHFRVAGPVLTSAGLRSRLATFQISNSVCWYRCLRRGMPRCCARDLNWIVRKVRHERELARSLDFRFRRWMPNTMVPLACVCLAT